MRRVVAAGVATLAFLGLAGSALGASVPAGVNTDRLTQQEATADIVDTAIAAAYHKPLLVVTVRAQGSNRFGLLYWEGAQPSVSFDVFRNGVRIKTVSGSTTGNNFYTDAVKGLRGTFTYKVCYSAAPTNCSNSITVLYSSSTETIRYAPVCPTTGTAKCLVTLE